MTQISIAVPVYNSETMLREALECLRTQTFRDFEVLILDNCSTDSTRAIAQEFVDADPRFRLQVQPFNKGVMQNFIDGLHLATAPYFLWRAFDDVTDDHYLADLHALLAADPRMKLATGIIRTLYLDGGKERVFPEPPRSSNEALDILSLMFRSHAGWFYGLWDREALRIVWDDVMRIMAKPWAFDHLILLPFILDRAIAFAPTTAFTKYIKRTSETPRDRRRPPVAEMLEFRRDFIAWCRKAIGHRFCGKPLTRAILQIAVWFYAGKRVYRFRTVLRRALVERWRGKTAAP
jgi:glycosyltransferase involved in cell wall biosynthesis